MAGDEIRDAALAYAAMGLAVIPLRRRGKEPLTRHGRNDCSTDQAVIRGWWERWPDANVGIATGAESGGLVVIDVDVDPDKGEDGGETLREWELAQGELPETAQALTGGGGVHILYRADGDLPNSANPALGVDIRGQGGYIVAPPSIHPSGARYEWEYDPSETPVAALTPAVAAFIDHVRPGGRKVAERAADGGAVAEGGRNDAVYRFACSMRSRNLGGQALLKAARAYNDANCVPPLSDREVVKVCESAMTRPAGLSDEAKAMQKTALGAAETAAAGTQAAQAPQGHVAIAEALMRDHRACFIDGMPAVRDGGIYRTGWQAVNAVMVEVKRSIKSAQRREVREYLTIAAPRVEQSRWTLVGFENGVLDIETTEFRGYTDDDVICNVIPHRWNPAAECPEVDALLDRVSCGDRANRDNIEETAALCALRTARFGTCPVFVGDGANGKSTVLTMIRGLVGMDNISALQPREVNARFQGARLVGKTANLGDDISSEFLTADECAGIKKVATGDLIYSDVKSAEGIEFTPYATMVFSANEFPRLGDSTPGMYRRLHPIEFNARFTRDDPDYDPNIVDKVTSEEAMERLAVLAMLAVGRLRDNRGMTPNAASERILDAIQEDNNTVLMWARMTDTAEAGVIGRAAADVYRDYKEWCFDSNAKPLGVKKFNKALRTLWHVEPGDPEHATYHGRQTTVRHYRKAGA